MVKTVIIDCDGVLTDGKVSYTSHGERTKTFHSRDIRAIRELVSRGFDVYILTQSTWPGLEEWAQRTGATVHQAINKLEWLNDNRINGFIAIADDVSDIRMLDCADLKFCPNDADIAVQFLPEMQRLTTNGGEGVISEMIRLIS